MSGTSSLYETISDVRDKTKGEKIDFEEVVQALNHRGFGPLILLPSIIVILPTGAIPGVPLLTAIFICLIAGQIILGRKYPWLPKRLRDFSFSKEKFERGVEKMTPYIKRIDNFTHERFQFLTSKPIQRLIAVCCIGLALSMIPLGFVPFACMLPAIVMFVLALGISAKDGILILTGFGMTGAFFIGLPFLLKQMEWPF